MPVETVTTEAKSAMVGSQRSGRGLLGALGVSVAVGTAVTLIGQRRGLDNVDAGVEQARGADAAPATAVGFGR